MGHDPYNANAKVIILCDFPSRIMNILFITTKP